MQRLSQLKELNLHSCKSVGKNFLSAIQPLCSLERLDISDTSLIDSDLEYLSKLTNLQSLDLSRTQITSHAFKYIGSLHSLESLWLPYNDCVNYDALDEFYSLNALKNLYFVSTTSKVSDADTEYLTSFLPECDVKVFDWSQFSAPVAAAP